MALSAALGAGTAQADRLLLDKNAVETIFCRNCGAPEPPLPSPPPPPPDGQIEGPCGLAVAPANGDIYVSDYHHRQVEVFAPSGDYKSQFAVDPLNGVCGLAFGPGGALYANRFHEGVVRLQPSFLSFEGGESTGVAVDAAGNVYANDRTHVAVYEPDGDPVLDEGQPLRIGQGSLVDGFGLAVFGGRVYVPDAAEDTVKVYEPALDPDEPVEEIVGPLGGFESLTDAAVAVDPTNGHLLVLDNDQPGFAHPESALYEFEPDGDLIGKLPGSPGHGQPSGIALASDGVLYVTDGNSEEANVYRYSSYGAGGGSPLAPPPLGQGAVARAGAISPPGGGARASAFPTERVQKGSIRIAVSGGLTPTRLPRRGTAPITIQIGGEITPLDPEDPPQLAKVRFAFNRAGKLDRRGLPRCGLSEIDPSNTQQALAACGDALVGSGLFKAKVRLPEQSPFPSAGRVLAFNGNLEGKPVIFAHIFGRKPVPTSIVLPLRLRQARGTFGTLLDASMADLTGEWGYVTGLELRLGRRYSFRGERRSFLSAGCPAPKGFPGAIFPLAKTSFSFVGGRTLEATLTRSCRVR